MICYKGRAWKARLYGRYNICIVRVNEKTELVFEHILRQYPDVEHNIYAQQGDNNVARFS